LSKIIDDNEIREHDPLMRLCPLEKKILPLDPEILLLVERVLLDKRIGIRGSAIQEGS
jgi:hypothetical protein